MITEYARGKLINVLNLLRLEGNRLMPRSHQTFRPIPTMKIVGVMLRNRCKPTTFHTITAGGADGWCLNWPV